MGKNTQKLTFANSDKEVYQSGAKTSVTALQEKVAVINAFIFGKKRPSRIS